MQYEIRQFNDPNSELDYKASEDYVIIEPNVGISRKKRRGPFHGRT